MAYLKLKEFEKNLIEEISTLSGHQPLVIREILEFTFLRQLEQYMKGENITVPYLGRIKIQYKGDTVSFGAKQAEIEVFFSPSDLLRRLVGDISDGESEIIDTLLIKKVESALQAKLDEED
jgi:hypothetical protein